MSINLKWIMECDYCGKQMLKDFDEDTDLSPSGDPDQDAAAEQEGWTVKYSDTMGCDDIDLLFGKACCDECAAKDGRSDDEYREQLDHWRWLNPSWGVMYEPGQ